MSCSTEKELRRLLKEIRLALKVPEGRDILYYARELRHDFDILDDAMDINELRINKLIRILNLQTGDNICDVVEKLKRDSIVNNIEIKYVNDDDLHRLHIRVPQGMKIETVQLTGRRTHFPNI